MAAEEELPVVDQLEEEIEEEHEEEEGPHIENIRAEKLEGPKIVGKIELPVDNETRPKPSLRDEKRKRKRIPIDKKGDSKHPEDRDKFKKTPHAKHAGTVKEKREISIQKVVIKIFVDDRRGRDRRGRDIKREEKEIDQKEIQEKIRETQAKLAGASGRGKSLKAKYRREKRQEHADAIGEVGETNKLQVTEFVTVSELANLMDVSFADVISKCMSLGIMVSINQRLDAEVIELVAGEFGYEVEFIGVEDAEEEEEEIEEEEDESSTTCTDCNHYGSR